MGVLCIPQSSSITGTSPADLVSYLGHSFGGGFTPLQRCNRCIIQSQPTGQRLKSTVGIRKKLVLGLDMISRLSGSGLSDRLSDQIKWCCRPFTTVARSMSAQTPGSRPSAFRVAIQGQQVASLGLVWFYSISTILGYLMSNQFYTYKQFYFKQYSLA